MSLSIASSSVVRVIGRANVAPVVTTDCFTDWLVLGRVESTQKKSIGTESTSDRAKSFDSQSYQAQSFLSLFFPHSKQSSLKDIVPKFYCYYEMLTNSCGFHQRLFIYKYASYVQFTASYGKFC